MIQRVEEDLVTYSQFRRLVPDGQKADLIDGVIYMASPDKRRSNRLNGFIYYLIEGYDGLRQLGGEAFVSRFACRLTKHNAPEPDALYVAAERLHLVTESEMRGAPNIAVEVVSRDSCTRDYRDKKLLFEQHGVSEYWIIDPLRSHAEFHRLVDGKYQLVPLEDSHIFRSAVLPGFWLDTNWLFNEPLPAPADCLAKTLAS